MIVESFYSHMLADAAVSAITTRIFPQTIPDGQEPPAITFQLDGDDRNPTFDGVSDSLKTARFDVNAYSLEYLEAHALAEALEAALAGTRGNFGTLSPPDFVDQVRMERKFDIFETQTGLHRVSLNFIVLYR